MTLCCSLFKRIEVIRSVNYRRGQKLLKKKILYCKLTPQDFPEFFAGIVGEWSSCDALKLSLHLLILFSVRFSNYYPTSRHV